MSVSADEQVHRSFRSVKEIVRYILSKKEKARDDDKILICYCMKYYGVLTNDMRFNTQRFLEFMPSTETIRRVRQEIQNTDGEFLPTSIKVCNRRRIREDIIRTYYGAKKNEREV